MEYILYLLLMIATFFLVRLYVFRENLTLQELETQNKKLIKKVDKVQTEYEALTQKIDKQQKTMKDASDKATSLSTSITAAVRS